MINPSYLWLLSFTVLSQSVQTTVELDLNTTDFKFVPYFNDEGSRHKLHKIFKFVPTSVLDNF